MSEINKNLLREPAKKVEPITDAMWQQVNSFLRQQFNSSRGSHIKDCWLI